MPLSVYGTASASKVSVSRDLGVPESSLRVWVKDKEKLRYFQDEVDTDHGLAKK